ncbi:MAG: HAD hydrolase family protein [Anaerohalosphaeraceae bacterium]|nr:HAD hydrolase family protein [Anaerohalosphaeraceae bacterium]
MTDRKKPDLAAIKLLAMDVDGVLTDGSVIIGDDGSESKKFNLLDGHGIKLWHRAGLQTALISGRMSNATQVRAKQLGINFVYQPCPAKLEGLEKLLSQSGFAPKDIAYIGDDVLDIPVAKRVGFSVAVDNAVDELKKEVHYITSRPGGAGAVREVVEYILKNTGRWQELMERYLV